MRKVSKYIFVISLVFAAIALLGHFNFVVIKYLSNYNFEFLLVGFVGLLITKLLRK